MPAVTIGDTGVVRISDSQDTKAVLQADSTTQYFLPPRMTTAQKEAIASPAEGAVVFDTDNNQLEEYTGAAWQAAGGGAGGGGAPTDATYITQTANGSLSNEQALSALATGLVTVTTTTGVLSSVAAPAGAVVGDTDSQTLANKILSQLQLILGGFKAIFTHSNSADRTYTLPNYDGTLATVAGTETFTNKTIDADGTGNVITNIGSSEVKAELITGLAADATPDAATDYVMTYDASGSALKKVLLEDLPSGGSGLYTSVAILRDEKTTGTAGGSSSATTWNNRNLNTETYDPDNIVSIASNQFTPIAGDYILEAFASGYKVGLTRIRLYNVTGAASVEEGIGQNANSPDNVNVLAPLICKFTANGTDAYRIDHYTATAQATNGLGFAISDGSPECYLEIILRKLA